jgi:hypothetical protein
MNFESRRAKALDLLKSTGMLRSNYEPPLLRAFWKIGFEVPPPHFLPFWKVMSFGAVWFGGVWGVFMWLAVWSGQGVPLAMSLCIAALAGAAFGLFMSFYYAHGRRKYRLPAWSALDGDPERN